MSQLTKSYLFSTGVFENLSSNGPGSVEIYDTQAGEVDACLNSAVNNVVLRSHIPQFWKAFIPQVETLTGEKRTVNAEATAKAKAKAKNPDGVADVLEGWNSFITRVWATQDEAAKKELTALAVSTAAGLEISVAPASREGGGKAIAASFYKTADSCLALSVEAREAKLAKLVSFIGDFDFERDADGTPDRTAVAKAVKLWSESL